MRSASGDGEAAHEERWSWKSWVTSANEPGCDFPLQNLPFCVFDVAAGDAHLGVGIGDFILDLHGSVAGTALAALPEYLRAACQAPHLNDLMACGQQATSRLRGALMAMLRDDANRKTGDAVSEFLRPRAEAAFRKPVQIGNYTDFYASIDHATNVGRLFRPDQPLLPNYKYVPVGYHGRASSLVISGTSVVRPRGQIKQPALEVPAFELSRQLDYEIEVGAYIGTGNVLGQAIAIDKAESHLFGISLVNDWSARDIQAWEYQPLGPFLGKSFATSVSPWVVTMDALEPFRVPLAARSADDPQPLPYLSSTSLTRAAVDVSLEVYLTTRAMRNAGQMPVRLSLGYLRELYWSFAQMVTHHSSNGCNLLPGDLLASGTVSGTDAGSEGSLLEMTQRGSKPLHLPNGDVRSFLEDGDEIILRGFCERPGLPRIGLGECRGIVVSGVS